MNFWDKSCPVLKFSVNMESLRLIYCRPKKRTMCINLFFSLQNRSSPSFRCRPAKRPSRAGKLDRMMLQSRQLPKAKATPRTSCWLEPRSVGVFWIVRVRGLQGRIKTVPSLGLYLEIQLVKLGLHSQKDENPILPLSSLFPQRWRQRQLLLKEVLV